MLFAADLFNEGLDVPDVDTVLFLRPTESATLFLQQLGRGLRRTRDKAVLTVLDFVGHHRKEFRFDRRLRALTGATRRGLERDIERGFPFLPSGCQIVMDRQSQTCAGEHPQPGGSQSLAADGERTAFVRRAGSASFPDRVRTGAVRLVRSGRSWTQLRRAAGLPTRKGSDRETELLKRIRAFARVDDERRCEAYARLLAATRRPTPISDRSSNGSRACCSSRLWPGGGGNLAIEDGFEALRREPAVRDEVSAVVDLAFAGASHVPISLAGALHEVPLQVHARYQREEILAALDYASLDRKPNSFREGVLYVPDLDVDAFFVTLRKSEADYSPTTLYRDYPISPALFTGSRSRPPRSPLRRDSATWAARARSSSSCASTSRTSSAPVPTFSPAQPSMCSTAVSDLSPSPGDSSTSCRTTSSPWRRR